MEFVLGIAVLLAFPLVFWFVLKFSSAKIETQYRALAEHLGLEIDQPPPKAAGFIRTDPSLYGDYRGREVSFSTPGKGIKGTRQIETVLKVELKDKTLKAQIAPTGFLAGVGQRKKDKQAKWKSGDGAFDQAVEVRSDHGDRLATVLNAERKLWLSRNLKASKATLYIANGTMAYVKLGLIADEATRKTMVEVVEFLCDFAEAVEST